MCRHLATLGPVRPLAPPLFEAPHALERQSHAPALQDLGRINADGWGVGWWDPTVRPEPARYRTATPMWADRRFREIAPLLRAGAMVAAARNASPGAPVEETGNAPFTAGPWLFSHNGFVDGFRGPLGVELRRSVSAAREQQILGAADSEVLFALLLDRLDDQEPAEALVGLLEQIASRATGRYNFLLGDGTRLLATRWGNSLHVREGGEDGTVVASEPLDDDAGWREVPDRSLVSIRPGTVEIISL